MFQSILFAGFVITVLLLSTATSFGQDQSRTEDSSAVHAVLNDSIAVKKADKPSVPKLTFHENLLITSTDQLKGQYKSHRRKAVIGTVWGSVGAAFGIVAPISWIGIINNDPFSEVLGTIMAVGSFVGGGTLATVFLTYGTRHKNKAKAVKEEINRRNRPLSIQVSPAVNLHNKSAGLTLSNIFLSNN